MVTAVRPGGKDVLPANQGIIQLCRNVRGIKEKCHVAVVYGPSSTNDHSNGRQIHAGDRVQEIGFARSCQPALGYWRAGHNVRVISNGRPADVGERTQGHQAKLRPDTPPPNWLDRLWLEWIVGQVVVDAGLVMQIGIGLR